MDLLKILRSRAASLPEGDYTLGINAVVQHVEVATKHLTRGHDFTDETAFTDSIYRTNQAFEGSLKEAYRVLTGKDPAQETPNNIESYLQQQNLLRPRVLAQFSNYRREWRNPSTHDYRLDFNEDEALLAIVTVSAFAIVLIDQIAERVSFNQTKATTPLHPQPIQASQSFVEQVSALIGEFVAQFNRAHTERTEIREVEVIGALAGFLSSAAPQISGQVEGRLDPQRSERADLVLVAGAERLIVEVKAKRFAGRMGMQEGLRQVSRYMALSGITQSILFVFLTPNNGTVSVTRYDAVGAPGRITVIVTNPKDAK